MNQKQIDTITKNVFKYCPITNPHPKTQQIFTFPRNANPLNTILIEVESQELDTKNHLKPIPQLINKIIKKNHWITKKKNLILR